MGKIDAIDANHPSNGLELCATRHFGFRYGDFLMLRSYIDGLYKIVEQEKQERELAKQKDIAALQTRRPEVKPLEQQLVEHFRSLSSSQVKEPLLISDLIHHLKGRIRDHPHPQLVASELRKLGWQRRRLWGVQEGKRLWFPPT